MMKHLVTLLIFIAVLSANTLAFATIAARSSATTRTTATRSAATTRPAATTRGQLNISTFSGAVGDGVTDDTVRVQKALTHCSDMNLACVIPTGKTYLITGRLYLWGGGDLIGTDSTSKMLIQTGSINYIINIGISSSTPVGDANQLKPAWFGRIENVTFVAGDTGTGRMIYFWRTNGGTITRNVFDLPLGKAGYGPTSSGNDAAVVTGCPASCTRTNLTMTYNTVTAYGTDVGNEGLALNTFTNTEIAYNTVTGTGDDPIAVHFSDGINVHDNVVSSTDGRLLFNNVKNSRIVNNQVSRMASLANSLWYQGIGGIYLAYETTATNGDFANSNDIISGNTITYPAGCVETNGRALYVYGPRTVEVINNTVVMNCGASGFLGMQLLSFDYVGTWTDPDGLDPVAVGNHTYVRQILVNNNNFSGGSISTGFSLNTMSCAHVPGPVTVTNNRGASFSYACTVSSSGNVIVP